MLYSYQFEEKDKNDDDFWTTSTATKTKTMNAILINPIVMASAAASILGAMMCLALYVVKCTIDERDALHVQEYDALYDKCIQLRQKVNTMAAEMSQMRLEANEQTAGTA